MRLLSIKAITAPGGPLEMMENFTSSTRHFKGVLLDPMVPFGLSGFNPFGRLATEAREVLVKDRPFYVVLSYHTPIAWCSHAHGEHFVSRDDLEYGWSVTTARHSNLARVYMGKGL